MKALSKKAQKELERHEAIATLLTMLKPKDVIYTDIKSVSSNGMSRQIACYIAYNNENEQARIKEITYHVAKACDWRTGSKGGLIIGGCGMDMAFHLVYNLGRTLWPNGTPEPHGTRNGVQDSDGGYALKKEAL